MIFFGPTCYDNSGVKSALIRRGDQGQIRGILRRIGGKNVKRCSSSGPEMSVFENTLMSSEEDLIKASVAKMVLEDDLTSASVFTFARLRLPA